jgi:hypothetical protein
MSELLTTRTDNPESRPLELGPASIQSVSPEGEMLINLFHHREDGTFVGHTLARVPLAGGAPRPILETSQPLWADWMPGGEGLALLLLSEGKTRIEYPRGKVIWRSHGYAWDLRVAPAGDALAFCQIRGSQQAVVMLDRAGKVVARSAGWSVPPISEQMPSGCVAWGPDGKEIWFAAARPGSGAGLYALARDGEVRPLLRVPGSLSLFDVSRDGRALLSQVNRRVSLMVRAPGETEERDLSWFERSSLADLSADGRWILFTEYGEGGGAKQSVYLRRTDSSPAVRLGDGVALALSPDGHWALARGASALEANRLFLLPTGAGEPRALSPTAMEVSEAKWLSGGKQLLVGGTQPGHGFRHYVMDGGAKNARPLTRPGTAYAVPSPDGTRFAAMSADGVKIYPIAGGEPLALPGVSTLEWPIQWRSDGRALYFGRLMGPSRCRIDEVDLATGRRSRWKDLRAAGSADSAISLVMMTLDGEAYAYEMTSAPSTLYLVEGLR